MSLASSNGTIHYIDTEGTFRTEKIQSIASARGLQNYKKILGNILLATPKNAEEQESYIEKLCSSYNTKAKLLIIDSMLFRYKAEYAGRRGLSERASRLNTYMYKLRSLAQTKKIVVVITNHSTSNPDDYARYDIPRPYGGNIMSYTSDYIINFACEGRMLGSIRATLVKSPLSNAEPQYLQIEESGFRDRTKNF